MAGSSRPVPDFHGNGPIGNGGFKMVRIGQVLLALACVALVLYRLAMPFTSYLLDAVLLAVAILFLAVAFGVSKAPSQRDKGSRSSVD